jgi:son of sevenless-like protein
MKYWLSSHHFQLDPQLLWQMKEFALSALSVKSSEIMKSKAKDFMQSIDQRVLALSYA